MALEGPGKPQQGVPLLASLAYDLATQKFPQSASEAERAPRALTAKPCMTRRNHTVGARLLCSGSLFIKRESTRDDLT